MSRERDKQKMGKYEGTLSRENIHILWNLIPSRTLKNICCITKSSKSYLQPLQFDMMVDYRETSEIFVVL